MKMKVDLSKFKLKHKDDKTATLVHPDGHEVRIAIGALHPNNRPNLDKLELHDGEMTSKTDTKMTHKSSKKMSEPKLRMAEGGDVPRQDDFDYMTSTIMGDTPARQEQFTAEQASLPQTPPDSIPMTSPQMAPEGSTIAPQTQVVASPPTQAPQAQPEASVTQPSAQSPYGGSYNQVPGYEAGIAGIQKQAQAEQDVAKASEAVYKGQAEAQLKLMDDFNLHHGEITKQITDLQHDILNGHIDPNRYLGSMDTGQKMSTGIALALGGLGAGLTGGSNQALDFLNRQIDRDIKAQEADLGKKETLLSANLQQLGDLRSATDMTRLMMNGMAQTQIQTAIAKSGGKMAEGRALELTSKLQQQAVPLSRDLALYQMMKPGTSTGATGGADASKAEQMLPMLRVYKPEMAKEIEGRLIPGVGLAAIPVPPEDRRTIIAKQTLDKVGSDFYDWASKHSGSISPSDINVGKTKAAEFQSLYRNSINGGVFKKGEQEFIDTIIDSDPSKFFNSIRVLPKLREVLDSNKGQLNVLNKSFGLPQQSEAKPEYKTYKGVKYMRGPNGEAVPVKE